MAITQKVPGLLSEISQFFASAPSREQILNYRPPEPVQQRARELLDKLKTERLTAEERRELDQFEFAELLMRLINARIRAKQVKRK
jgi:hypothetical protein